MCTMRLASYYLPNLPARSLPACCATAGITLSQHHSALDAQAAAALLARYRAAHRAAARLLGTSADRRCPGLLAARPRPGSFQPVTRQQQILRRASQRPPLARLVDRLPRGDSGDIDTYLGVLDRVLEDRIVSADELLLSGLATNFGPSTTPRSGPTASTCCTWPPPPGAMATSPIPNAPISSTSRSCSTCPRARP
jgi:hypothetical protein